MPLADRLLPLFPLMQARRVRTRLYFTSESHLHTLVNVLRFMPQVPNGNAVIDKEGERILSQLPELCYLTHLVIRVFENMSKPLDDPSRFRVELGFSPGVDRPPRGLLPQVGRRGKSWYQQQQPAAAATSSHNNSSNRRSELLRSRQ